MALLITAGLSWMLLALPLAVFCSGGIRLAEDTALAPFRPDDIERFLLDQASAPLV